jgi:hypothetical protein
MMRHAVTANLVAIADYACQHLQILWTPVNLPPVINVLVPEVMCRVVVGNEKKCAFKSVSIEYGKGSLELATKAIIKGEGNDGFHSRILRDGMNA